MSKKGTKYNTSGFPLQGEFSMNGLDIKVEQRKGSVRSGTSPEGKKWETKMLVPYGYIENSIGVDEDCVDCFIGDNRESTNVYVVHQVDPKSGDFDEDKVMLGFDSAKDAKSMYLKHYDTPKFFGSMTEMSMEKFKKNLNSKKREKLTKALDTLNMSDDIKNEDNLEKGHIAEAFKSYGDRKFTISKKGSEIKKGLEKQIAYANKSAAEHSTKAGVYLEYIKEIPTEDISRWSLEPFTSETLGRPLPKVFDGDKVMVQSSDEARQEPTEAQKTTQQLKYKYNRCIRQAVECIVESRLAETMQGGIEDNKKYELTIQQAAVLGI